MRDRLSELQSKTQTDNGGRDGGVVLFLNDSSSAFFAEVEVIRALLDEIETQIQNLASVHRDIQVSVRPSVELREKAEDIVHSSRALALRVRKQIKGLEDKLPKPVSGAFARMLDVQQSMLERRLQNSLATLNSEQVRQRDRSRSLLEAQLRLARASLQSEGTAEEELQRLLHLDQETVSVFTDNIVLRTRDAKQELEDIQARQVEILTLERNIRDVRDLFVEISLHVESQGEMINRIENHVLKSGEQVESGHKELASAQIKKSSARKKKFFCLGITVIVLIILVSVLIFFL